MLEFCPECNNLMRRKIIDGWECLACRCGYHRNLGQRASVPSTPTVKTPRKQGVKPKMNPPKLKDKPISWDPPDALALHAKIKDAPWMKSGGSNAASEPSTVVLKMIQERLDSHYYDCSKCKFLMSANLFCTAHEKKVGKNDICKAFEPVASGFGAKTQKEVKRSSAQSGNRRCGTCIFFQDRFCHAQKRKHSPNDNPCEQFEYIYERSEELFNKKD